MVEWPSHITPIVRKLVTYARYDGHSCRIERSRCSPASADTPSSRTSSVIAIAKHAVAERLETAERELVVRGGHAAAG